jgi:purine-binding chemotaxis protein CheW
MSAPVSASPAPSALAGKYLTVGLAGESYAISVHTVREIIRIQNITPVPQMPPSVRGVINLRGRVIPILDLRTHFGLEAATTAQTCIIVVQLTGPGGRALPMGLIVDAVHDVALITAAEIEPAPEFGAAVQADYLFGLAKHKGQVRLLLNLDRVVDPAAVNRLPSA